MARIVAAPLAILAAALLLLLWLNGGSAQDGMYRIQTKTCANSKFAYECPENLTINILSITILSSIINPAPTLAINNNTCPRALYNCTRTFKDSNDQGFKDLPEYDYFYKWMFIACEGKGFCNGTMPAPDRLHGINQVCSSTAVAYFVAAYFDGECLPAFNFSTIAPLPETTIPTTDGPSTEALETAPMMVPIATGALSSTDRIVLAVTICSAIIGLFLLLLLLYCCDKWRREKKKLSMFLRLGKPEQKLDAIDEIKEFAAREAWMHETEHAEALGEYCGVKPEEVFTINRKTMDRSDKARQDGAATLQRGYTATTLQRGYATTTLQRGYATTTLQRGGGGDGYSTMQRGGELHSATSVTTLVRTSADKEFVNSAYLPSTFERTDVLHY